jgi:hypothetical protein
MRPNFPRFMLAMTLFGVCLATFVTAANAADQCTAATLTGNYGFSLAGSVKDHGKTVPFAGAGLATTDGQGNASATHTISRDGNIASFPWTGTYVVNPDCTGSATSTSGGANFSFVIVRGGDEFVGVAIDSGATWTIDFKKQ